ncbi:MAG: lipoprotein-releasing system transmembrane subunit LolC [Gammaproteobacteria bacterium]|nr:lipoprotein-releasing system transmembrane subunit LolC [Gammaproteobacteria bacterium]
MSSISFKLGYRYLRSTKGGIFSFTTILAILGLTIGVSSLIIVTSVMNGFQKELENRILGVIPHSIILSNNQIKNYDSLIEKVRKNPNITAAAPYINIQGLISSSYDDKPISLIGTIPKYEKNISIIPDYMVVGDIQNLYQKNSAIIGASLAANLGAYVGDDITLTTTEIRTSMIGSYPISLRLKIVGIYELKTEIDQYLVLTSHETAQRIKKFSSQETSSIRIKTNNLFKADEISNELLDLLGKDYYYQSWKETHGTLFEAIKFEKLLISLMLFLIVAVASILVLSTIVMTVKSKEREIAILRTLGASSNQLILIFFTQGLIVSVIGIFFGLIIGYLFTININNMVYLIELMLNRNLLDAYFINYFPYYIDSYQILFICLISFLISIITSFIPSLKATKLNPLQILRHE